MDKEVLIGILLIVGYIIILGGVPVFITRNKNRGVLLPFLLGIFLGPIGWLIAIYMKPPLSEEGKRILEQQRLELRSKNKTVKE